MDNLSVFWISKIGYAVLRNPLVQLTWWDENDNWGIAIVKIEDLPGWAVDCLLDYETKGGF